MGSEIRQGKKALGQMKLSREKDGTVLMESELGSIRGIMIRKHILKL